MRLIRLTLINMKRQLRNPVLLLMGLVVPVFMLMFIFGDRTDDGSKIIGSIGIIEKSNSAYSAELIEELSQRYKISIISGDTEDIRKQIMDNKVTVVYEIGEDFKEALEKGEIPTVKCYRTEATVGTIIADDIIRTYINDLAREGVSEGLSTNIITTEIKNSSEEKKGNYTTMVLMICYFMMMGGSIIAEDLLKLKSQKVLRRTISTGNTDKEVLGGIFISAFLIQGILGTIGFMISKLLLNMGDCNMFLVVLVIFLGSLTATAVVAAATRWIKNPAMASLSVVVFGLLAFGAGMFGSTASSFDNIPEAIIRVSAISPFTWLYKIMDTGEVITPTIVIILMALVFFTAGSFRLREFAKE